MTVSGNRISGNWEPTPTPHTQTNPKAKINYGSLGNELCWMMLKLLVGDDFKLSSCFLSVCGYVCDCWGTMVRAPRRKSGLRKKSILMCMNDSMIHSRVETATGGM